MATWSASTTPSTTPTAPSPTTSSSSPDTTTTASKVRPSKKRRRPTPKCSSTRRKGSSSIWRRRTPTRSRPSTNCPTPSKRTWHEKLQQKRDVSKEKERRMSVIDELLRNNEKYASTFDKVGLPIPPGVHARDHSHVHGRPIEPLRHARAPRGRGAHHTQRRRGY